MQELFLSADHAAVTPRSTAKSRRLGQRPQRICHGLLALMRASGSVPWSVSQQVPSSTLLCERRRVAELEGAEEANERARALLAEQRGKLAEAREFLTDRQESIAALQQQLAAKDAQVRTPGGGCTAAHEWAVIYPLSIRASSLAAELECFGPRFPNVSHGRHLETYIDDPPHRVKPLYHVLTTW